MELLMFWTEGCYDIAYKTYFLLLSKDIIELKRPHFPLNDDGKVDEKYFDALQQKIYECLALHEGLFPLPASTFVFHELSHLPDQIRNFGPLKNTDAAAGERGVG